SARRSLSSWSIPPSFRFRKPQVTGSNPVIGSRSKLARTRDMRGGLRSRLLGIAGSGCTLGARFAGAIRRSESPGGGDDGTRKRTAGLVGGEVQVRPADGADRTDRWIRRAARSSPAREPLVRRAVAACERAGDRRGVAGVAPHAGEPAHHRRELGGEM